MSPNIPPELSVEESTMFTTSGLVDIDAMWRMDKIIPVPGFGFFPSSIKQQLEETAKDWIKEEKEDPSNFTIAETDMIKCNVMENYWPIFMPHLDTPEKVVCAPMWDSASCLPPTEAGHQAVFPCMTMYEEKYYDPQLNASRMCLLDEMGNGIWENLTNYSSCREIGHSQQNGIVETDVSLVIYYIGYSISLISLFIAVCIFFSFREIMRCLRHKIHISLFLTFILDDFAWILHAQLQNLFIDVQSDFALKIWCFSLVILRYFHLSTFFWMFLEGLYLFLQVQVPLSMAHIRHRHFLCFGWLTPLFVTVTWLILRININSAEYGEENSSEYDSGSEDSKIVEYISSRCPFIQESSIDTLSYQIPIFILLSVNTVFLIFIMWIVIQKLKTNYVMEHDRQHLKAAKALFILIPILGLSYLLTLMGPDSSSYYYFFYQVIRASLLSTQGFVITLPYCFFNSEVRNVVKNHWKRWKLIRNVGLDSNGYGVSTRTSVACSTTYCTQIDKDKSNGDGRLLEVSSSNYLEVPGRNYTKSSYNSLNNETFTEHKAHSGTSSV